MNLREELKVKKAQMEKRIEKEIMDFYHETGFEITKLSITRHYENRTMDMVVVTTEVEL